MSELLIRTFVKDWENVKDPGVRRRYGYLCGGAGIVLNFSLFLLKLVIGFMSNSIAILTDAFNNFSDFSSSVMTLVGFWTAGKPADREHPFGHGRSEYLAALILSLMVMIVGFQFAKSSLDRILHPEPLVYSGAVVGLLAASIPVKLWMALFYRKIGRRIDSRVMEAAVLDSTADIAATGIVVLALLTGPYVRLPFDGYVGMLVALLIIWNGWKMVLETLSPLMGEAPSEAFVTEILERLKGYEGVLEVHDLIVHNYGPGRTLVSLHAEIPLSYGFRAAHDLVDRIEKEVGGEMGIHIVIHMDPVDCESKEMDAAKESMDTILEGLGGHLTYHDLRLSEADGGKVMGCELVIPDGMGPETAETCIQQVKEAWDRLHPDCPCTSLVIDHEHSMLR